MIIDDFNKLNLPEDHYLLIAKNSGHKYFDEFIAVAEKLKTKLKPSDFKIFWNEKMLLDKPIFREKVFIQGACEAAVANYFSDRENFELEARVNTINNKDVDCRFTSKGFTYNIEVKCPTFDAREEVEKSDAFKFHTFGRIENRQDVFSEISKALDEGLVNQGKEPGVHKELKNMDNNLKDFLESAHEKFSADSSENEVNVLLVGCNDKADMQSWLGYLFADGGLFSEEPFSDTSKFQHVDMVILTNLYFKHKDFHMKQVRQSWSLDHTLNFVFYNPYRAKLKNDATVNFFDNEIRNYTMDLQKFEVPGNVPEFIKNVVRVPHFVIDHLEKKQGVYLFEINEKKINNDI